VSETAVDLDAVNCVDTGGGLVLEQPRYLEPIPANPISPPTLEEPPTGLTPTELERWCNLAPVTDCSTRTSNGMLAARARLCVWNITGHLCTLREITQADYTVYAPGKATFSEGKHNV